MKTIAMTIALALTACTTAAVDTSPDAAIEPDVRCTVQVLQTIDGASTCAVTVTVEVACANDAAVGSATITAETTPWLDTGEMSGSVDVACGQTQRMTFGGMPCAEAATGLVTLDDGTTCDATKVGL